MRPARVSIKEVATEAGVSLAMVSRVVNNSGYVQAEKRSRIQAVIKKLGYRPDAVARSLVSSSSRTIGLCVPYLNSLFIADLMSGVEAEADKYGYDVFISHTRENPDSERDAIARLMDRRVDGIIVVPVNSGQNQFKKIMKAVPTVFLLRQPVGVDRNLILADDYKGSRRAFSLLLDNGHREIGIVGGPEGLSTIRERRRAVDDLLREHNLEADARLVVEAPLDYRQSYEAVKSLLLRKKPPTAIYTMHNWATQALVHLFYEFRLDLPKDLSVAAYESYEEWNDISPIRFASNIFPTIRIGAAAVKRLHSLISGKKLYMDENLEIDSAFFSMNSVAELHAPAPRKKRRGDGSAASSVEKATS